MTVGETLAVVDYPEPQASAILLALDPHGFGGITVRSPAGPVRDNWLQGLRALMGQATPWRRLPIGTTDERLFGGFDLPATLAAGRPVMDRGLLAESDGGMIVVPMAERLPPSLAARLSATLDTGRGPRLNPARFGLVALDEGVDDETVAPRLQERLAFFTDLGDYDPAYPWPECGLGFEAAQARLRTVLVEEPAYRALVEGAASLGVHSLRALAFAVRVARSATALAGRTTATPADIALAARLILAPRATQLPQAPTEPQPDNRSAPDDRQGSTGLEQPPDSDNPASAATDLTDVVLAATKAALPPGLLMNLKDAAERTARQMPGRAGAIQIAPTRGRPVGIRRDPRGGRLSLIETLRAAAPWQALRSKANAAQPSTGRTIAIRRDDFRFMRFKQRTETVTVFAVDASGSLALHRLAEAKGAVELLLAECYVRRDQVALLAFRGTGSHLLLPPTRSLARAKRSLADLAGGGATPLAVAIDDAVAVADGVRRRGRTAVLVFLTDGRANVARDGSVGRAQAEADAFSAASMAGESGFQILVVDAAPRPQPSAQALAAAMRATYLPLPRADAAALTAAVRTLTLI